MTNRLMIILLLIIAGVIQASEVEKATVIVKPQVSEQVIKIEFEVPEVKVEIPPIKIEQATGQVDVGTIITQVEGYYSNALNNIFNMLALWLAVATFIVAIVLWYLGNREKKRETDFNKIRKDNENTQKLLVNNQSKIVQLELDLKAKIGTEIDGTKEEVAQAILKLENKTDKSIVEISTEITDKLGQLETGLKTEIKAAIESLKTEVADTIVDLDKTTKDSINMISEETKGKLYQELWVVYLFNEKLYESAGNNVDAINCTLNAISYIIRSNYPKEYVVQRLEKSERNLCRIVGKIQSIPKSDLYRNTKDIIDSLYTSSKEKQRGETVDVIIARIEQMIKDASTTPPETPVTE